MRHPGLRRLLSAGLALCLLVMLAVPVTARAAGLEAGRTYTPGQFTDVDETAWYGQSGQRVVATVYELGLMTGDGASFNPAGTMTLAEAVTMAARVHHLWGGGDGVFVQGSPWYQVYVDYALAQGILPAQGFDQYLRPALRGEMALIFANALPERDLPALRRVDSLPDVTADTAHSEAVFRLYRAGVLSGSDAAGTFYPGRPVDRASAAAILARLALPNLRSSAELVTPTAADLWAAAYTPKMWVDTEEELHTLFLAAMAAVVPEVKFSISDTLYDRFGQVWGDWLSQGCMGGTCDTQARSLYDYQSKELSLEFEYDDFRKVAGLLEGALTADQVSREVAADWAAVETLAARWVDDGMSVTEKAAALHDGMIHSYSYDLSVDSRSFSYAGLLDRGTGVCQAYMQLYYLLCTAAGVPCRMVMGYGDNGADGAQPHGWNQVLVDGIWLHVDVTFDDPIGGGGRVFRDYFLLTDEEIGADHLW